MNKNKTHCYVWKLGNLKGYWMLLFMAISHFAVAQKFNPGTNKTILLIGQTYKSEYEGYVTGIGTKPAGSSHYGTLYQGTIEQGDDNPNGNFLDWIRNYQSQPYALVALSMKDNTDAGGYGQMINQTASNYKSKALYDALVAVGNGAWDAKIDAYANSFASRPDVKFFVRIDYEVSLFLFAYKGTQYCNTWLEQQATAGINVFENPDTVAQLDRQAYITAYNRIANRIKAIASNVAFVYHPVRGFNDTKWLYPGDQNVDYVAFSVFNNDMCMEVNGTFNCAGQAVDPQLQKSMDFAKQHGKAIMIAESAVQAPASRTPAQFNLYLEKLNNLIVANDVKVVSYINSNWPVHGWDANWGDSRVETNTTVKNYWNSIFLGTRYVQGGVTTPVAPVAASNLLATATSSSQINLSWTDNATNESGYYVERATAAGTFAQIASLAANTTTYNSTALSPSTAYSYRVRAYNATGNAPYSNTAAATTTATNTGGTTVIPGKFTPPAGKTMLIIGQDLASISDYVNSAQFPTPAGVTSYVSFFDILNQGGGYGALGMTPTGQTPGASLDLDWGGGPLNTHSTAVAWPNSTLQIGLNMSEYANSQGFLAQLGNGQKDAEIKQLAAFFKKISPKPVYLRIGYEFDGQWNAGYQNKTNFINAFRRIVTVLRSEGVTNVAYVWQACASPIDDILEGAHEDINGWYPGDTYVDWVALSWFLLPTETPPLGGSPANQITLANEVVDLGRAHNKPVMIAESTPQGYNLTALTNSNISTVWDGASGANTVSKAPAQIWSEWFTPFFNYIHANSDAIRAVSYINANWNAQGLWAPPYSQGYWGDTRVQANATIKANWQTEINTPFWLHGGPTLFNQLGNPLATDSFEANELSLSVYPNPNKGIVFTNGLKVGMHYKIINNIGAEIFNKKVVSENETIDISNLASGLYIIKVTSDKQSVIKRIVLN
jgi:beta-mannanase